MDGGLEMTDRTAIRALRAAAPLWTILALAGAVAWVVTASRAGAMGTGPGTMGMGFPFFLGMWLSMMAAMMLPAIGPQAAGGSLGTARRRVAGRIPGALAFGAGFLVPWVAYGTIAFLALTGYGRLAESSPDAARWLGVGILAMAGLYQFTPVKLRALAHCRMTMRASGTASVADDLRAGIADGAGCVRCCWALMATLVAVGVMNLPAMAALAALILAEKMLPRARLVAALGGVVLLAVASIAAIDPALLSGLVVSQEMPMEGM